MKDTVIKILKIALRVLRGVLYALSAGHICKCEKSPEKNENESESIPESDAE